MASVIRFLIPTKNETIKYGNEVLNVIYPILNKLSTNFKKEIDLYTEVLRMKAISYKKDDDVLRMAIGTVSNLTQDYLTRRIKIIEQIQHDYDGTWLRKNKANEEKP